MGKARCFHNDQEVTSERCISCGNICGRVALRFPKRPMCVKCEKTEREIVDRCRIVANLRNRMKEAEKNYENFAKQLGDIVAEHHSAEFAYLDEVIETEEENGKRIFVFICEYSGGDLQKRVRFEYTI